MRRVPSGALAVVCSCACLLLSQRAAAQQAGAGGVVESMNPDISLILDFAAAAFTEEPMQLGAHDPARRGFNLQQLELYLASNVGPYFRLESNIVFGLFGVEVEEAYGTTLGLPGGLQVRAGQMLTRFGRLNSRHPHAWSFADQPLVLGKLFGGEGHQGLGVEASWLVPLPWFTEVVLSGTHPGEGAEIDRLRDLTYTTALKQFFPLGDAWSLKWGLSAQLLPNDTGHGNRTEVYGTDLYLRFRPVGHRDRAAVSMLVEAMLRSRQVPGDTLQDFGGLAQLVYHVTPRWETGLRYEYVSGVDDPDAPEWTAERQRASLQGTFYPSHFSRIRLQGSWDAPGWLDEPSLSLFLALELLIGAHGSHEY